jgi:CubicO group peptidase (beta-lactamase class C family)
MEEEMIAGAAIDVSQNGEILYQMGFGVCDLKTKEPVTPDTIFGIASISKSFTAMAIMKLAEEGKLSLDDPVIKYLPEFKLHKIENMKSVKIHHLLSHTAGLPPMRRREELNKFNDHLEHLAAEEYELLGLPGQYFSYCNDTFLLLGAIIERLKGRLYRRYITECILEPLHMHRSTFSLEEVEKFHNVSVPYVKNRKTNRLEEVPWPRLGNYEVGGGIRSNVRDLLKYGQLFINEGTYQGHSIVSKDYIKKMWDPVHRIGRKATYRYALRITPDYSGVTLVEHGGSQPGVSSHFGFVPEKGLVVAVLTNVANVPANEMWLAAINTALGFPLEQKSNIEPLYGGSIEELQRLVGTYRSAEGGKVTIFLDHHIPKAEIESEEFVLRPSDHRTLVIEKNQYPISFFFKDDEKAWAAFYGSRMLTRVKQENEEDIK